MRFLYALAIGLMALISFPGWCQDGQSSPQDGDGVAAQMLADGTRLVQARNLTEAVQLFDKVIASYEERFNDEKTRFFCARSPVESLMYLAETANAKTGNAKVVSVNWAYAYYLKAYALLELGRVPEAKLNLERALALSPRNAQFLSELGNVYQRERNWPQALQTFQLAEAAAKEFSPPNVKNGELSRAWRGVGFVYVEQSRLDEAEKIYLQCLELDKNDTKAASELAYVRNLKVKQSRPDASGEKGETTQPKSRQASPDPIYLNDAVHSSYFAALRCRGQNDPPADMTNMVAVYVAAAKEMERRNPGMQPPEVGQALNARLAKVKTTVDEQVDKRGCEAADILQLVENFKSFSKRPGNAVAP